MSTKVYRHAGFYYANVPVYPEATPGKIFDAMRNAKVVRIDTDEEIFLTWYGAHQVHAYTFWGDQVGIWSLGNFADASATKEEVIQHMNELMDSKEYYNC